jgi:hypothetical protein
LEARKCNLENPPIDQLENIVPEYLSHHDDFLSLLLVVKSTPNIRHDDKDFVTWYEQHVQNMASFGRKLESSLIFFKKNGT